MQLFLPPMDEQALAFTIAIIGDLTYCQEKALAYQIIELNGCDTLIHARDDLLCDSCSIDVIGIKAIT